MSDNNETKNIAAPAKKSSGFLWRFIVISILLALVASVAYFGWYFWQSQNARVTKLESQLVEQAGWFATAMSQQSILLEKQKEQLAEFKLTLEKEQTLLRQRIDNHSERLQALTGSSRTIWILEEARYLLRLANQRQLTGGNAQVVLGLLEAADALLSDVDVPDIFTVRNSLYQDILSLKVSPQVDRESLYLQLSAVIVQLEKILLIPVKQPNDKKSDNKPQDEHQVASTSWYQLVWRSVQGAFFTLDNYVRVNRHDQSIKPLLSEYQQQVMATNLRLMLEQSQMALLQKEPQIYQHSLQKVSDWLRLHYQHFPQYSMLQEEISQLQQANVIDAVPSISRSLTLLGDYIKQQSIVEKAKPAAEDKERAL